MIGAGAIGGVAAAALVDAGHRPTVCVRTPIDSLVVEAGGRSRTVPVDIVADPAAVAAADWVLVTVKAQDTAGAGPWLERLCGPDTVVVVLQNGIGHRRRVAPWVGPARVLPALVYVAAERVGPGRVAHHAGSKVVVPDDADGRSFADLLAGSVLDVVLEADLVTEEWRKLLSNVVANPITALTMRRLDVMRDPGIEPLGRRILDEAVAVGRAEGADIGPQDVDAIFERYRAYSAGAPSGSSMYYDRLAGRRLEYADLTGALVEAAGRHGIPVPFNEAVLALLAALDRGDPARRDAT